MIRNPALRHCGEPTLLVHSMKGGFVNSNCTVCGHRGGLTKKALREAIDIPVKCPICKQRMAAEKVEKPKLKNYYIACGDCRFKVLLATCFRTGERLKPSSKATDSD